VLTYATREYHQETTRRVALLSSTLLALLVGTLVYLLDRDWASTRFLAPLADWQGEQSAIFGALGQVLPSFCHAYAFALLLILALGRSRYARQLGAVAWFAIAAGLEFLQAERLHILLPEPTALPAGWTLANSIYTYFANGHFDPADLLAAGLGCLVAFLVSSILEVTQ
jgi:hypothetical protein